MKNTKTSAILFALLAFVQALFVRSFTMNSAFSGLPIFAIFEIAAVIVFAVLALRMVMRAEALCCGKKQALVLGTILYVIFAVLNGGTEIVVAQYGLSTISPALTSVPAVVVALIIKLALLAGAVAFAVMPEHKAESKAQSASEAEAAAEQASISADTVAEAAEAAVTDSISE